MQMNNGVIKLSNIPDGGGSGEGVVHIEGQETITGSKTFSANTYIGSVGESADLNIVGDLNIQGDIIQNGSSYETHAEKIYTKNDYITLRDGAESGLLSGEYAGFEVEKYDGTNNGRLVIDNTGTARVGDEGDEQPLLTRDESASLTDDGLLIWDSANSKAINLSTITTDALGNLTATSFNGTLNGNATSATKATNDGADNNIIDTYANRLIGNISNNIEVYNKLEEDYHSTFDVNKFTIVGTPTITDDGIASGFSDSNYLIHNLDFSSATTWEVEIQFKSPNSLTGTHRVIDRVSGADNLIIVAQINNTCGVSLNVNSAAIFYLNDNTFNISANTNYIVKIGYDGTSYYAKFNTGADDTVISTVTSASKWSAAQAHYIGRGSNSGFAFNSSIDLKQFSVLIDEVPVFSGNQTGIDIYTINSETVSIPYTLSSTNDKIVDMYYLNRVQDATDYLGYNNYALINETDKEFIIPQGYEFNKIYNIQGIIGNIEILLNEV